MTTPPGARPAAAFDVDRPVAAFDVDGTLTTVDTFLRFVRRVSGTRAYRAAVTVAPLAAAVGVGAAPRDRLKARFVGAALRGLDAAAVAEAGRSHAETIRERWLRPDTVARLRWHRERGDRVVLVSASLRPYLDPLGAWLGAHDVVCTDLGVDARGRLDGTLPGGNCRGPAKVERLLAHLGGRPRELWAYGDSAGDRELLALADHGHLVTRGRSLGAAPSGAGLR